MPTTKVCTIGDCDLPLKARGLCNAHYRRALKGLDIEGPVQSRNKGAACSATGCEAPAERRGWCNLHYRRALKHGDPEHEWDRSGERNPCWRGDAVTYVGAHARVKRMRGSASTHACVDCQLPAHDWSLISGRACLWSPEGLGYSGDPADYEPRCKRCHNAYDGTDLNVVSA